MLREQWIDPGANFSPAKEVRTAVFVEEQGYPLAMEFDELDARARHLVLYDGPRPAAAARLIDLGDGVYQPGRIAVLPEYRGRHAGAQLMKAILRKGAQLGAAEYRIGAQVQARGFYEKFGFQMVDGVYMDGHIPHVEMIRRA